MYALKTLLNQYLRFIITAFGVSLCLLMMFFLFAIYHGVSEGTVRYIRENDADLWVLQRNAANLLRNTSILTTSYGNQISDVKGVNSIAPILFFTAMLILPDNAASVYLAGYDPQTGKGGPPEIIEGDTLSRDDQIILDYAFAAKYKMHIGDKLIVKDDTLVVAGLSGGTNMFVIQFAFITLSKARDMIGFPGIVSCYQVFLKPGADGDSVAEEIKSLSRNLTVFDRVTFLNNNIHEAETGVLPMLYVIGVLGGIVLTALLSLILSVYVLEQQKDYAIMKALGASDGFVSGIIIKQSLILAGSGLIIAVLLLEPMLKAIEKFSPTMSVHSSVNQVMIISVALLVIILLSSILPLFRQRRIYPIEVFR
ncbi:MAG TPA: FtsX-like permease family protein [Chitinophagales bacterium]|nr:FtsX-like permease family protein [Chitinophagales bacterium]